MNRHRSLLILAIACGCLAGVSTTQAAAVAAHHGSSDPATEGWTLNDYSGLGGTESPGVDTEPYWRIQSNAGAVQRYLRTLGPADVSDPQGWTYTARIKLNAANDILECSFGLIDGREWWQLHLVAGGTPETTGVFLMTAGAGMGPQLSTIDPRAAYHMYQIVFDPGGAGGAGQATYYLDGVAIGTRTRGENYNGGLGGLYRLDFGDIDRGSQPSDSQWSLVRYEIGQYPMTNDACEGALAVSDGSVGSSTLGAAANGTASCGDSNASPDLWYAYTATCTGQVVVDTCGSQLDTVVSVYSGACDALTQLACNQDCGGAPCSDTGSCVSFSGVQGQTFYIRVAGANGASGDFNLRIRCGGPLNDYCASAQPVGDGIVTGTTLGASPDGTASCGTSNGSADVWYAYTPSMNGLLHIDSCGSDFNTVVSVYNSCGGSELASGCNDDCDGSPCGGPGSCLAVPVTLGHLYVIRVGGADGTSGDFKLTLQSEFQEQFTPVYQEVFATGGTKRTVDFVGWAWINQAGNQYVPPVSSNPGISAAAGVAVPPDGSINSHPSLFDNVFGYFYAGDPYPDEYGLFYTEEYTIRRPATTRLQFSWVQRSTARARLALRIGSTWFASGAIPGVFGDWPLVGPLDPETLAWQALDYVPGTSLSLGVAAPLPAGDITAFGLVIEGIGQTEKLDYRLDNFRVEAVSYADSCTDAIAITDGATPGTTAFATPGGNAPCGNSNNTADVWYAYTASCAGQLAVDTCGSGFDTVLAAFSSCGGTQLACDDNTCGTGSRITLQTQAGQSYRFRVSGANGAAGKFALHVACGVAENDTCSQAQVVSQGQTTGTTAGAGAEGTASCGQSNASPDVWYKYTATCNAPLDISTCGSSFDTVLSVYDSCGGSELACNDNACGQQSQVEINATMGTTYLIRVSGSDYGQGSVKLNIICKVPPANDNCANAVTIADVGVTHGTTTFATSDGDANCGNAYGSPDVWYRFTAPKTGQLKVKISSIEFNPSVSVHQGTCPANLENVLACGTPSTSLRVIAGNSYLIRVAGSGGGSGAFDLDISYGTILIEHIGKNDPAAEGWTLNDYTGVGGTTGPGTDSEDYWRIQANAGAAHRYVYALSSTDVSDPSGWTYTARVRVNAAAQVWETSIGIIERNDWWTLSLVTGAPDTRGVYMMNPDYGVLARVSDIDPSAAYHTYQIVYDPSANGGAGGVTYYLDGVPIGTQARGEGPQVPGLTRLDFGDNDRGSAATDSQWSLVRFEVGSSVACGELFADVDHDGDVDQDDFGEFQRCYTGSGGGVPNGCQCFDREEAGQGDGDVDSADYTAFSACISGPSVMANPACGG